MTILLFEELSRLARAIGRKSYATVNVADFLPSTRPGAIDYGPYIQAACDAVPDAGGSVYIPSTIRAGGLGVGTTIRPKATTRIFSDHPRALRVFKIADVPIFDVSGTATSVNGEGTKRDVTFENFTIAGAELDSGGTGFTGGYGARPNPNWNKPLLKAFYVQFVHCTDMRFMSNWGKAIDAVQWWDGYLTRCRFDYLGKGDGSCPAVHAARLVQGVPAGQFGYSVDNTNNLWMTDCVGEQNRDGVLYIDGRDENGSLTAATQSNNRCYVKNLKCESAFTISAPFLKVDKARFVSVDNLDIVAKDATSPQNLAEFSNILGLTVNNYAMEARETASASGIRTGISFKGIAGLDFRGGRAIAQVVNKPTVAFMEVDGTCSGVTIDPWRYVSNPGNASLSSLGTSTWAYRNTGRGIAVAAAPSASTLGSVVRRIEVVDATGGSLGFVPVYNTIT